eukprot:UN00380
MKLNLLLLLIAIWCLTALFAKADETTGVDIFTAEEREALAKNEESHEFQAEVNRLMDILINSLYTTRDIFLRETISNAADALDKVRFLSLTEPDVLAKKPELDIKIHYDKEKRILKIIDTGVGMTKDELKNNLGVVAKSGTTEFLNAATKQQDKNNNDMLSLIGQFGVGFYSVYLVADKVTVTSKSYKEDSPQYVWESSAKSKFTIAEDPRGNTLGRGTEIALHLKPDADDFLNDKKITELIDKYSQFINFPIYVATKKTVTEEVEDVDAKPETDEDVVVEDDAEKKKTKTITKEVYEDVQVNTVKPLWTRSPSDITDEEYKEFYKSFSKDRQDYLAKSHFSAEGDFNFKSLLFIPSKAEWNFYDKYYEMTNSIKLYVRRVLISDDIKDVVPRYLNFVKGLVDSEDLPLNVNREMLSQNKILNVMAKKVTRKVLDMLKQLANDEKEEIENYNEQKKKAEENPDEVIDVKEPERLYTAFWNEFGKSIKLGCLDDHANRVALSRLLRFKSTKTSFEDKNDFVSLEEYLERKKDGQEAIYFLTGESFAALSTSPFLNRAKALAVEVLLLTDPLDEYLVQSLTEYESTPLQSLSREGVKLPGDHKPNLLKKQGEDYKELITFLTEVFNTKPTDKEKARHFTKPVEKVIVSHRLGDVPLAVVATQYGQSAGMERIMKAQALSSGARAGSGAKKTVEINPFHPAINALKDLVNNEDKEKATELAQLLFDGALITSGYGVNDQDLFVSRINKIVARSLDVLDKEVLPEPAEDIEAPVEQAEAAEDAVDLDNENENVIKLSPDDIKVTMKDEL